MTRIKAYKNDIDRQNIVPMFWFTEKGKSSNATIEYKILAKSPQCIFLYCWKWQP